jgi:hypothetical protein
MPGFPNLAFLDQNDLEYRQYANLIVEALALKSFLAAMLRQALFLAIMPLAAGCAITRDIQPLAAPEQVHLEQLEMHLNYVDPDAGREHYRRDMK